MAAPGGAAGPFGIEMGEVAEQPNVPGQQHENGTPDDGWEPVPVPLPTYVTAPVAPRTPGALDLGTPDTWSSARSSAAADPAADRSTDRSRSAAAPSRRSTPLFDQYADPDRPRAANE